MTNNETEFWEDMMGKYKALLHQLKRKKHITEICEMDVEVKWTEMLLEKYGDEQDQIIGLAGQIMADFPEVKFPEAIKSAQEALRERK